MNGILQKDIPQLPDLEKTRYENIFKIYTVDKGLKDKYYFYNILNKVAIPDSIDKGLIDSVKLTKRLPWTTFSFQLYGTIQLWWLIVILNKPKNIFYAEPGITYKYFKQSNIDTILTNIIDQVDK